MCALCYVETEIFVLNVPGTEQRAKTLTPRFNWAGSKERPLENFSPLLLKFWLHCGVLRVSKGNFHSYRKILKVS